MKNQNPNKKSLKAGNLNKEIRQHINDKYDQIDNLYKEIQNYQDQINTLEHCLKFGFDKGC